MTKKTQDGNYRDLILFIIIVLLVINISFVYILNDKVKQQDETITKLTNLNGKTVNTIANIVELLKSKQ